MSRGWVSAALFAFLLASARAAVAQTVTLAPQITRQVPVRPSFLHPTWVSLADCDADDAFVFSVSVTGAYEGLSLEVWAGTANCRDIAQRQVGMGNMCWLVAPRRPIAAIQTVAVRAQDLVARNLPAISAQFVPADASTCRSSQARQAVRLYFLPVDDTGQWHGEPASFDVGWDLTPPGPPARVTGSAGRERAHLTWTRSDSADVYSYRFYCEATGQAESCGASDGGIPGSAFSCGEVFDPDATSGIAAPLVADQLYRIRVVATDEVGNVGSASPPYCVTAVAAAPTVGSSGCATSGSSGRSPATRVLAALWLLSLAAVRRRRQRSIISTSTPSPIR